MSGLSGLGAWLLQRLSAVYLLVFMVLLAGVYAGAEATGHGALTHALGHPAVALAAALFVLSLLVHSWVGMRDVIIDYLRPAVIRLAALVLLATWLLVLGLWSFWLLIGVTFP